jgi:hypothetical protein
MPGVLLHSVMLCLAGFAGGPVIIASDSSAPPPAVVKAAPEFSRSPEAVSGAEAMRDAAASGNAQAQFKYGDYLFSRGDFTNAVIFYRKAAEHGSVDAQLSLASCYANGRGVSQDLAESSRWSRLAARHLGRDPFALNTNTIKTGAPARVGIGATSSTHSAAVVATSKIAGHGSVPPHSQRTAPDPGAGRVHTLEVIKPRLDMTSAGPLPASPR